MGVVTVKGLNCGSVCTLANKMIGEFAYWKLCQSFIAPAGYLKDKWDYDSYLKYSEFLADINNERAVKNPIYKERIMALDKVLLVINEDDEIVYPTTSGWFDFYKPNSNDLLQRRDSNFYKENHLGIRYLEKIIK